MCTSILQCRRCELDLGELGDLSDPGIRADIFGKGKTVSYALGDNVLKSEERFQRFRHTSDISELRRRWVSAPDREWVDRRISFSSFVSPLLASSEEPPPLEKRL